MAAGVRGRLISETFARTRLPELAGYEAPPRPVLRRLALWAQRLDAAAGPATSVRGLTDALIAPLLRTLGYDVRVSAVVEAVAPRGIAIPVLVVPWDESLDTAWRSAVLHGVRLDARWCFCCNGTALRIVDSQRTWARRHLEFDLRVLGADEDAAGLLWAVARADAMSGSPPLLDRAVEQSAQHGVIVCRALGTGVLDAVTGLFGAMSQRRAAASPHAVFEDSLTVLHRVLFLLFAEARGLVPLWHPIYRDRYSIDTIVTTLLSGGRYRGLWQAIRAISRLVSAGCVAGELKVTAFNGRLFSAERATSFDRVRVSDEVLRRALLSVGTTTEPRTSGARVRIAYRDLDVEQLGAVYEHVLEYEPAPGSAATLKRTRDTRKATGTFYTPRAVTASLVRRTLDPLVQGRSSDDILRLRVVDPAMGSGAFLVAACRYLAAAAEEALIREGRWHHGDVTPADRAGLRREIAQRCLFGVDLNPTAVQLARLSLWLATLAADLPLTFLDHRLVVGDSLVGATPDDVRRQPTRGPRAGRRPAPLPLFEGHAMATAIEDAVRTRVTLAHEPDDSAATVRGKERTLAALQAAGSPLRRWTDVLDLWCAGWFWRDGAPPGSPLFAELCDTLLHARSALPAQTSRRLLDHAAALAAGHRFHHWPLAFPEVFWHEDGEPRGDGGFDAVLGNPPWDMVRGDSGEGGIRSGRRADAQRFTDFVRASGVYRVGSRSHVNRYQLFVERALQLVRPGGRIGLVLPSGIVTDAGAAPLRRHLFDHAEVDGLAGLDNRGGIFPIHRGVRFVLLTGTAGRPTHSISCRFGITDPDDLERPSTAPLVVTRRLLSRLSGDDDLAVPEMTSEADLRILEKISAQIPLLGSPAGWNVHFSRELNASDDRHAFAPFDGSAEARPVIEGKHIEPFRTSLEGCRHQLRADAVTRHVARRPRLAYRDVASATNRLTLIAAVVPARVVTTHTLFCLRNALPLPAQHVLCALLNSFVANYLVRGRVNTHVTASLMSRLPVPVAGPGDPTFMRLAHLSRALADGPERAELMPAYAELQALAARLYGLSEHDFAHVLATFPLVAAETRSAALAAFSTRG
ncbi:MAG: hypothetical protein FJW14_14785 [Acidimicrobiia bacterium]|nr:hypothetical protein [Acidimicrobiia bacterium]